eukprot:TRINITY_DN27702_c0_g1_i1.p1 TRINITY_DN27702_c0_g1~~TRINITY_DN27702_c0_g1_i1.p1  ORF type:complete len:153 (-),score=1.90 TRINITY_DN27702_c0_g1_i1:243-701(-)
MHELEFLPRAHGLKLSNGLRGEKYHVKHCAAPSCVKVYQAYLQEDSVCDANNMYKLLKGTGRAIFGADSLWHVSYSNSALYRSMRSILQSEFESIQKEPFDKSSQQVQVSQLRRYDAPLTAAAYTGSFAINFCVTYRRAFQKQSVNQVTLSE